MKESNDIEELIAKWMDDNISPEELSILQNDENFQDYLKLKQTSSQIKIKDYNVQNEFEQLQSKLHSRTSSSKYNWTKWVSVAAILVLVATTFYIKQEMDVINISSDLAALEHELPYKSMVTLNANSSISYNEKNWSKERHIELKGEALFEVSEGEKFLVKTQNGLVKVTGTKFNVNTTDNGLKVICYSGQVVVTIEEEDYTLEKNDLIEYSQNIQLKRKQIHTSTAFWINNENTYQNVSIQDVLSDFTEVYGVKVITGDSVQNINFTGGFEINDIDKALYSICKPLGLEFTIKDKTIEITKK